MRETDFIKQNKAKWAELERMNREKAKDPVKLSKLFIEVTNDLSYSKSYYPNRSIKVYLNNLALAIHSRIYKNKVGSWKRFSSFWSTELPRIMYETRWSLFIAFLIFSLSMAVGVVSSIYDPGFARHILGDSYVSMTMTNINNNDPMAVYKDMRQMDMFVYIAINNIWVSFLAFVLGASLCVGTVAVMIGNGVMVGVFQWFFIERGLFQESFLTIWMHGTPEIMSIVLAGSAGMVLGRGILFPGTYTRKESFLIAARRGIMIMLGITPVFLFAAFVEGFATRYTELNDIVRASIILISGILMVYYFVMLPYRKFGTNKFLLRRIIGLGLTLMLSAAALSFRFLDSKDVAVAIVIIFCLGLIAMVLAYFNWRNDFRKAPKISEHDSKEKVPAAAIHHYKLRRDKKNPVIYTDIFALYSREAFGFLPKFIGLSILYVIAIMLTARHAFIDYFLLENMGSDLSAGALGLAVLKVDELFNHQASFWLYGFNSLFFGLVFFIILRRWASFYFKEIGQEDVPLGSFMKLNFPWVLLVSIVSNLIFFIEVEYSFIIMFVSMPILLNVASVMTLKNILGLDLKSAFDMLFNGYGRALGLFSTVFITALLFLLLFNSGLVDYLLSTTLENFKMSDDAYFLLMTSIRTGSTFLGLAMVMPLFIFGTCFGFVSFYEMKTATGLKKDILDISPKKSAYGLVKE